MLPRHLKINTIQFHEPSHIRLPFASSRLPITNPSAPSGVRKPLESSVFNASHYFLPIKWPCRSASSAVSLQLLKLGRHLSFQYFFHLLPYNGRAVYGRAAGWNHSFSDVARVDHTEERMGRGYCNACYSASTVLNVTFLSNFRVSRNPPSHPAGYATAPSTTNALLHFHLAPWNCW